MVLRLILASIAAALLLTSCSPAPDRLGVSVDPAQRLTIHYMRCVERNEQIERFRLAVPDVESGEDEVLWEVRKSETFDFQGGDELAEEISLRPGQTPTGFEELVALESTLPLDKKLTLVSESDLDSSILAFRVGDLRPGEILEANERGIDQSVPADSFRDNTDGCEPPGGLLGGFGIIISLILGLAILAAVSSVWALARGERSRVRSAPDE